MSTKNLTVTIKADTRELRRQLLRAELRLTRSRWRRLHLRFRLWRVSREGEA